MSKSLFHLTFLFLIAFVASMHASVYYTPGWNLLGMHTSKEMNVSDFSGDADVAWVYRDGRWLIASPNGQYDKLIERLPNETFQTLSIGEGAWFHLKENYFSHISNLNVTDKNITIRPGWQLLALKCDVAVDVSKYFNMPYLHIWRYNPSTKEWMTYPRYEGYDEVRYLKPSDGFWLYSDRNVTIDMEHPHSFLEDFPSDINITEGQLHVLYEKPHHSFMVCSNASLFLEVAGYFQYTPQVRFDRSHFLDEGNDEYNLTLCSRWGFGKKEITIHLKKANRYIFKPIGSIDSLKEMNGVSNGNYLYALGYDDGLHVFDVSKPLEPVEIGTLKGDFGLKFVYQDILYSAGRLYMAAYDWNEEQFYLYVVDVHDPYAPKLLKKIAYGDKPPHPAISAEHLYVAQKGLNAIDVYDISDPDTIKKIERLDIDAIDIDIFGKSVYVTTAEGIDLYQIDGNDLKKQKTLVHYGSIYTTGVTPEGDILYFTFRDSNRKSHVGFYRVSDGQTMTTKNLFIDEVRAITKPFGDTFVIDGILGYDYRHKKKVLVIDRDKLFLDEDSYNPFNKIIRAYNDGKDCISFIQVGDYMYVVHFDEKTDIFKKDSD